MHTAKKQTICFLKIRWRVLTKRNGKQTIMKYSVHVLTIGSYPEIKIDQAKFDELKQARKCLYEALAIEEKYELLLSNYLDLEKECLNVTADNMVRSDK